MKRGIFLLLGTNLGDRKKNLSAARDAIELSVGQILKASSIYQTAPWGKTDQAEFFNQAIEVATELRPESLLREILFIEKNMGRERREKWGERIIDIDILLYGDEMVDTPSLTIPHPQMGNRRFVLEPLSEIGGAVVHPQFDVTIDEMLAKCEDALGVYKIGE